MQQLSACSKTHVPDEKSPVRGYRSQKKRSLLM